MKIILAHNFYGSSAPSGENEVFLAEVDLLKEHGDTVIEFTRNSDDIRSRGFAGSVIGALSTPWSFSSKRALKRLVEREKPDIIHVHNSFPLLSPSIFYGTKLPKVLTLHNYRMFCAAGIPMRNGSPCTTCIDECSILPALKYGCYRNSRIATMPMATMIALHRVLRTWTCEVDAFIALTPFQSDLLVAGGLPKERVFVKPHFYPQAPHPVPWSERDEMAVFVGRLSSEKGVHILINAWKQLGDKAPLLELIGEGPERRSIEKEIREFGLQETIIVSGQLPFQTVQDRIARARLLILPSLSFEGFPLVIREALALGVPVAASRIGSLSYLIEDEVNGILFEPGNPSDLSTRLRALLSTPEKLEAFGVAAKREFELKYTAEINYRMLMEIYARTIEHSVSSRT